MASENRSTSDALAPDVNNQIDEKLIAEDTEVSTDNAGIASKNITDTITDGITELEQLLKDKPYQFGFLQTLRRFESLHDDKPRIGKSSRPIDDILRLSQEPSMAFSTSTLASYKVANDNELATLAVNFFGMFGANGPLPLHLTEYARDRLRNSNDATFSAFIDIFHNRMLSLFYRSWASAQPTANFDRPQDDRFSVYIGALFGLGMPSLRNRDEIPDYAKLHFSGRLSSYTHNVEGLIATIKSFFNIPVDIEEFVGEWMKLPTDCCCHLGGSINNATLGENITIGDYAWQCQQKFRIILGPLSIKQYEKMLPEKNSGKQLRTLVRNYIGDSMNWDVKLVLKNENIPIMILGENDYLGWNSWIGECKDNTDASDMVLEPMRDMT
ncbi:Uncharacterized protein ImpH/VasB [hydrothermal vent metagenome]|uniref:Uncharacterized protein ImpH/VasB n=1 Tax=hydrothermal vent metagenome TaxID=652676 RepID=A0A3B0WCU1_9ZZZZ